MIINQELKLLIAGEGGQGVQALGKIISEAAFANNLKVTFIPNYGVEQRGGVTLAFIKMRRKQPIVYPKFSTADILVWLSPRSIKRTEQYLGKITRVIYNQSAINTLKNKNYLAIDFDKLGEAVGSKRSVNMIILGLLMNPQLKNGLTDWLKKADLLKLIDRKFIKQYQKNPDLKKFNDQAFLKGYNLTL